MAARTKEEILAVLNRTMDSGWLDPILGDADARAIFDASATTLARVSAQGQTMVDNTTISNSAAGRGGSSTITLTRTASGTSGTIPAGYAFIDARGLQAISISDTTVGAGVTSVQVLVRTIRKTELVNTVDDPQYRIDGNVAVPDGGGTNALIGQSPAPSGYPPIVATTFTTVSASTPIEGGASDWLAAVGHERGQMRQSNESDASFRLRVRNVPDAVAPKAVSEGVEAAATALALPSPVLLESVNPGCSAQALADAQVDWFDSVFFSGLLDVDGNASGASPATDFMEDIQPDLVNLKPRETVSLREARAYFRILETGLLADPTDGRAFLDDSFFDDPLMGYPDIHDSSKVLGALMAVWEEAYRKKAAGVRMDLYLEPALRVTGSGTNSTAIETVVFTLLPPTGYSWLLVDGHFGWDAPSPLLFTGGSGRLRFTFLDGSTYTTPADTNPWGQRILGTDVVGATPNSRLIARVEGLLTSNSFVLANLVGNLVVVEIVTPTIQPPAEGLVQWVRGDAGMTVLATRVSSWADQGPLGQDFAQANPTNRPYSLGDSIDGIPCISFGAAGDANKALITASNFVDRTSTPMTGSSARTVMAVIKPNFDAAWGITGGQVWTCGDWQALFDLESTFAANGAYAFARAWRSEPTSMNFTPVTGGAGGPYDGTPILCEWRSPGSPNLEFLLNDVPTTLTPLTIPGVPAGAAPAQLSVTGVISLLGGVAEVLVWDYDLSTNPAAHAQAVAYFAARYPSLGL